MKMVGDDSGDFAHTNFTTTIVGRTYRMQWDRTIANHAADKLMLFKIGTSANDDANGSLSSWASNQATTTITGEYIDFTATATTTFFTISAHEDGDAQLWLDNLSLKEIGTATGWTDADQQLHIPQTALQSYNELAWFDEGVGSYVLVNPTTNIWNATNGQWNSVSCWINSSGNKLSANKSMMYWAAAASKPNLYILPSGSNYRIGYNTGNGEVFGIEIAQSLIDEKWNHWVMNWKVNSNDEDTAIDDSDVELFLNGAKQSISYVNDIDNSNAAGTTAQNDFILMSGAVDSIYATPGTGTEFSSWGYQLTQTDVNELYNDGKALNALTHSRVASLTGYWRNNGLSAWVNLVNPGTNDGALNGAAETLLIPAGVDSTRDAQGFIMNRQKDTSCLNLTTNTIAGGDGDGERVTIPGRIDLGTDDFSISFWAYKFQDWNDQWVISQFENDNERWYIKGNGGPPGFLVYAEKAGNAVLFDSDSTNLDGASYMENWMHVALVVDRDSYIKWYINGALTSTGTVDGSGDEDSSQEGVSLTIDGDVNIGWDGHASFDDHHFNGKINNVLVYSDALSAAEVLRNYNATKGSHTN